MKLKELHEAYIAQNNVRSLKKLSPEELKDHIAAVDDQIDYLVQKLNHYGEEKGHVHSRLARGGIQGGPRPDGCLPHPWGGYWIKSTPENIEMIDRWEEAHKESTETAQVLKKLRKEHATATSMLSAISHPK